MKPISLKIKGVNSFIEEQTIDFKRLTENGFFGIFGPTGSGKSTILDGITLALYGEVARKSSNYINTNVDSANVAFEFQISGVNPKKYIVEREFKTDKKTGNTRSGKCKVLDLTNGEPQILADTVGTVNSTCKEIIGLNIDDFTRTVVLPQGKFSEFLKLEGKSRRDMLERLFNLQKYGDDLARKLSREIGKEKTENNVLLGELKGFEDISEENKRLKEEEVAVTKERLVLTTKEFDEVKKLYVESEEIWKLQLELKEYETKVEKLKENESNIEDYKTKLVLAEAADRVLPYINSVAQSKKEMDRLSKEISDTKEKLDILCKSKDTAIEKLNLATLEKDKNLPELKVKEQELKNALEEKNLIDGIEKEISKIKFYLQSYEANKNTLENKLKDIKANEESYRANIVALENKSETLIVESSLKEKISEGVKITEKLLDFTNKEKDLTSKIEKLKAEIANQKDNENKTTEKLINLKEKLDGKNSELQRLNTNCPGENEDLLKLQRELSNCRELWSKFNLAKKDLEKVNIEIANYNSLLQKNNPLKVELLEKIAKAKKELKLQMTENLAYKLREELKVGEVCPVCGSEHHTKENIKHIEKIDLSNIESSIEADEKALALIEEEISTATASIKLLEGRKASIEKDIAALGEEFKNNTVEELEVKFNLLQEAITEYTKSKVNIEKELLALKDEISVLNQEKARLSTTIIKDEGQLKVETADLLKVNEEIALFKEIYIKLQEETKIKDFIAKNKEIILMEKEQESVLKKLKDFRNSLEILLKDKLKLEEDFNNIKERVATGYSVLAEKEKNRDEKLSLLKSKVKDINSIQIELNDIIAEISKIQQQFLVAEKTKIDAENQYKTCYDSFSNLQGSVNALKDKYIEEEKNLSIALVKEGFKASEEATQSSLPNEIQKELKTKINNHAEEKAKVLGAIESTNNKLKGRAIDEESFNNLQKEKDDKESLIRGINEEKIKLEEQLKKISEKLIQLGDLLKKKEKIDKKLGILSDLEKLFKGKKFVEFVAATRLKYVSIEASKRLKEITNGNYGLEVDEESRFIIRDYKNGGAERDASTLSGGETFVASLALALALSSEIQLKGTAPLELFFLDEGFGTLDDNLLEVVMSSLERIHNDKLKIGLISHVESIKNRVPVKLIVAPAEAGNGGSKVKIEKS